MVVVALHPPLEDPGRRWCCPRTSELYGPVLAPLGVGITVVTGDARFDALGAIAIGVLARDRGGADDRGRRPPDRGAGRARRRSRRAGAGSRRPPPCAESCTWRTGAPVRTSPGRRRARASAGAHSWRRSPAIKRCRGADPRGRAHRTGHLRRGRPDDEGGEGRRGARASAAAVRSRRPRPPSRAAHGVRARSSPAWRRGPAGPCRPRPRRRAGSPR